MRLWLFSLGLFSLLCAFEARAQAMVIERPRLEVLGFSPDGRFFAFRQSGIIPSTGEAYADLYITDVTRDAWVKNSPLRANAPKGPNSLNQARASLATQSALLLRQLGLDRALAGVAFVPKDRPILIFDLPWREKAQLNLWPRSGLAAPGCSIRTKLPKGGLLGYTLTLQRPTEVTVLHSDRMIPRSRGCPTGYRFASGYIKSSGNQATLAAMIAYHEPQAGGSLRVRYMVSTHVVKRAMGGS